MGEKESLLHEWYEMSFRADSLREWEGSILSITQDKKSLTLPSYPIELMLYSDISAQEYFPVNTIY